MTPGETISDEARDLRNGVFIAPISANGGGSYPASGWPRAYPALLIPVGSHVAEELVAAIRYPTKPDTTMLPQAAR
jgi:hypothetical protein